MRLQRFYINQKVGENKELTISDTELSHQLSKVFRFKAGDQIIIFDGSGLEYVSEIISLNKKEVNLKIMSYQKKVMPAKNISLYLSLIKKGNFELAVEKCTEIGVTEIHPIISERSEKKDLNMERLEKIVKEASEQSGRATLPTVFSIIDLEKAVSQAKAEGKVCAVFHTNSDLSISHKHSLSDEGMYPREVAVFIGPEGGWTEKEMELFKKNNFQICSLGQNVLRAETAAMLAVWEGLK